MSSGSLYALVVALHLLLCKSQDNCSSYVKANYIAEPFLGSIVITVEAFWTETLSETLTVHDQLSAALTKSFLTRPV